MLEEQLESLRKEYIGQPTPVYLSQDGWRGLLTQLPGRRTTLVPILLRRALIFASIVVLLSGSLLTAAQAATPGNPLYQIKLLSEDIVVLITGRDELKIERRAQEVIDLSSDSSEHLDEATIEYQEAIRESKPEGQESAVNQKFKQTLEKQEEKFKKAIEKNPALKDKLKEVIEETQKTKGEVKGKKDQKAPNGNGNGANQNHSGNQDSNQENRGQEQRPRGNNRQ